ncbi:hypothetical protein [Streptomyces sp. NPDC004134]|uniref:hypothetical protein n=1 Tax=Streptomyces sp. NPDC004134 TaxID=3364691 RepID=UPI0036A0CEC9
MNVTMKRAAVTAVAALAVLLGTAGAASAAEGHAAPQRPCAAQAKHVSHGPAGQAGQAGKRVHVKDVPRGHCKKAKRTHAHGDRGPVKKVVVRDGLRAPRR